MSIKKIIVSINKIWILKIFYQDVIIVVEEFEKSFEDIFL